MTEEMRQFVPVEDRRVIGEPPNTDRNYVAHGPKCGAVIDSSCEGYGLAGGGGLGSYQFCPKDSCDWFYKWLDEVQK